MDAPNAQATTEQRTVPITVSASSNANTTTNAAQRMFQDFAAKLSAFVSGSVTALTLEQQWAASKPEAAGAATLSTFLSATYATIIAKEQTALVRDPFFADYAGKSLFDTVTWRDVRIKC